MKPLPEVLPAQEIPLYSIGVISRMTGISMAALRAWERRYHFPDSERSAGGHRLYSEKDLLNLRWVKERIDQGLQTAQAIHALRLQEDAGHLLQKGESIQTYDVPLGRPTSYLTMFQDRLTESLLQKDFQSAELIMGEALASSSPEDLILSVIGPAIARIGQAWEEGRINIATEHLATNYLRQRLLLWMMSGPPPKVRNPIILACAPNEWHEGSLLILGALLRRRQWPVAYLGQAVPLPDLAEIMRELHPSMIVLVAMTESAAIELQQWPQWMPEVALIGLPVVGFGGQIYVNEPEWRHKTSGIYLGDSLKEALNHIERLIF